MGNCNYSVTGLFQLGSSFFFMPASQVCSPRHTRNLPVLSKGAVAAAILALTLAPIDASSPKTFQAATQADFLKGDVENLSIDSHGQLVLGPAIDLVYETSAPSRWTREATSTPALARRASSTRSRPTAKARRSTGRRRRT